MRQLTDEDVTAIVDALEGRLTDKVYRDLGKGLLGFFWKTVIGVIFFVAAYGALKSGWKP